MKKIILIDNLGQLNSTLEFTDAYLIGIKDMCVNTIFSVDLDELKSISNKLKKENKELFILLNKNFHNSDIETLKEILINLNKLDIKGIFYSDVAVIQLKEELSLNYDLVWAAEHATTNYNTINYWYNFGAKYTFISSDITYDNIMEIKNNTKSKLIVPVFGYLPMFVSRRHIVKNYLDYFKLNDNSKINYIEKENKIYPIVDNKLGTFVYSNNILNGVNYYKNLEKENIDYALFNGFNINTEDLIEVLKIYSGKSNKNINSLFENLDEGFLNKETIYRVKK